MTSTLKIDTIEPEGATTTLTVGESGQNTVITGAGIKVNTLKDAGTRIITKFTTVETTSWTAPTGVTSVDYLVVAGGGGSEPYAGGGGAGGMRTGTLTVVPATSYTVTVGAGGAGASSSSNGSDSVFSSITSTGGGRANSNAAGSDGGSGGTGASGDIARAGGSGVAGQGNDGGANNTSGGSYATGGGGGAGSAGGDATANVCGFGGQGLASSITGTEVYYAGGGGGSLQLATSSSANPVGRGGRGGGGQGLAGSGGTAASGAANTGGGGGGGNDGGAGGAGGSGIVVLSYTGATASPNTIFVSDGSGNLSSVNSGFSAATVLLATTTASSASSIEFISDIDSTYDEYIWRFYAIHVNTDATFFQFQFSDDGGTSYGLTKTTTYFGAEQNEAGTSGGITYEALYDLPTGSSDAGATNAQYLARESGNEADECCAGELHLFNPGSNSYFKQFYAFTDNAYNAAYLMASYVGGYVRSVTPVNAIKFTPSAGTFNGTIKMYGIK